MFHDRKSRAEPRNIREGYHKRSPLIARTELLTGANSTRESAVDWPTRFSRKNYRLPRAHASDNKFSARYTRCTRIFPSAFISPRTIPWYIYVPWPMCIYTRFQGSCMESCGSQESSFTEARAVERKVILDGETIFFFFLSKCFSDFHFVRFMDLLL